MRIVLTARNLQYVLDAPLGTPPIDDATDAVKEVYQTRKHHYSQVQSAILCNLEAELQNRFETTDPCEIVTELKVMFETHMGVESYKASKQFFSCMMEEGSSVSEHVLKMSGYAKKLKDFGIVFPNQLGVHRILHSLPPSYKNFVTNYTMQNVDVLLPQLISMLIAAEKEIKKEHQMLMVDVICSYCNGDGHDQFVCPKYLDDLISGQVKEKGIFDIHVIDVYLTGNRSNAWVFDTGSVADICNSKQELRNKR